MDEEKTLHDCLDCEGCICEALCKEDDEKYLSGFLTDDEE